MDDVTIELPAVKSWNSDKNYLTGVIEHEIILQNETDIKIKIPPGIKLTGEINPLTGDTTLFKIWNSKK